MITERDAMEYEVFGSAWTGFIPFHWLRVALAWLIARRVATRYARYRAQKEYGASVAQRQAEAGRVMHDKPWPPAPPPDMMQRNGTTVRMRQDSR